jgi:hypothetical protein
MIKLPSLKTLSEHFSDTFTRFKWIVIISLARAFTLIYRAELTQSNTNERNLLIRISLVLFLAMPLALSTAMAAERRQWKKYTEPALMLLLTVLLTFYYFFISSDPNQTDYYRFMLFMAGAHLLVSYVAFIGFKETNGFWQLNKTFFLQFLNATLYAVTLFIGLYIAIETVKFLFGIDFIFEIKTDLAIVIFTFFHTVFFLDKIPASLTNLEQQTDYPAGLKIFTQYVLLPLEVVYLFILYAYTAKIVFQWRLPDGGVAYLVLAFSITGILALLLLHPLRDNLKERWIRLFSHRFYLALLPLIVLLFIGIFRRIHDYGITENRYLVAVLAIWLTGIALYFLLSKRDDIRCIPVTLSIICFVLAVGPWNIFAVSRTSQIHQFENILAEYKLLNAENKIGRKAMLSNHDYEQLFSIVQFFKERDVSVIKKYFPKLPKDNHEEKYSSVMENYLGKYVSTKKMQQRDVYAYFSSGPNSDIKVTGFNYLVPFSSGNNQLMQNREWKIRSGTKGKTLSIYRSNEKLIVWDIAQKAARLKDQYGSNNNNIPSDSLSLHYQTPEAHVKIILKSISRSYDDYTSEGIFLYE